MYHAYSKVVVVKPGSHDYLHTWESCVTGLYSIEGETLNWEFALNQPLGRLSLEFAISACVSVLHSKIQSKICKSGNCIFGNSYIYCSIN